MFVGYARDHPGDCYWMFDPKTSRVQETPDVTWLRRLFYTSPPNPRKLVTTPLMSNEIRSGHEDGISNDSSHGNHGQDYHGENNGGNDNGKDQNEEQPDNPVEGITMDTGNDESTAPVRNIIVETPATSTKTRSGRTIAKPPQ